MNKSLFEKDLISKDVQAAIKPGFVIRPLELDDYDKGFLQTLEMLTVVGNVTKSEFADRFKYLQKHNHEYFTIVIEHLEKKQIVAAGTIVVERKFIHHLGLIGHIEDIVSHQDYRGFNLGRLIIEGLKSIGERTGCYKIDCSTKNVPFYEKCGFKQKEVEMAYYIPANDIAKAKL